MTSRNHPKRHPALGMAGKRLSRSTLGFIHSLNSHDHWILGHRVNPVQVPSSVAFSPSAESHIQSILSRPSVVKHTEAMWKYRREEDPSMPILHHMLSFTMETKLNRTVLRSHPESRHIAIHHAPLRSKPPRLARAGPVYV